MKALLFILLISSIIPFAGIAQNISGTWAGEFYVGTNPDQYRPRYNFKVVIEPGNSRTFNCITYSSLANSSTSDFYGEAKAIGVFNKASQTLEIEETILNEVKTDTITNACLMTCHLRYKSRKGYDELTGTYTSTNALTHSDCGGGTVYLKKLHGNKATLHQ